ncbi:Gfo/Idh/MocA family oxidoreductase, partial [Acinetobacter baumannii]
EGFELLGSWERSNKTIQQNYPSVKSYNSLEAILNDDAVELVIVNTPTYTHFEYAEKALQAGKHIVVEKAFTTTVAEAEALKALAIKQNKQI